MRKSPSPNPSWSPYPLSPVEAAEDPGLLPLGDAGAGVGHLDAAEQLVKDGGQGDRAPGGVYFTALSTTLPRASAVHFWSNRALPWRAAR